jgi:ATP adenylyltransferase
MDQIWSPWRFRYISGAARTDGCVFCHHASGDPAQDRERLILYRGHLNLVMMNLYPYTTGHMMVAPYEHIGNFADLNEATLTEMMNLAQAAQRALESNYRPEGYNLGMNLGKSAGAGIVDHLHLHFLPRWNGDTNFMTAIGETRVQPEDLWSTYDKLLASFRQQSPP